MEGGETGVVGGGRVCRMSPALVRPPAVCVLQV